MTSVSKKEEHRTKTVEEEPRYLIALEKFQEKGRSAALMALHRRCSRCWGTLRKDVAAMHRVSFEAHRKRIRECCSTQVDYVTSEMSVLEAVFRSLLRGGPKGLTLSKLHDAVVKERGALGMVPSLSPEGLRRMLVSDHYYSIQELAPTVTESGATV